MRRPASSTLFPYTTLFRSIGYTAGAVVERAARLMHGKTDQIHHDGRTIYAGMPNPFTATRYHSLIIRNGTLPPEYEVSRDRKSTRLNSSHGYISYAVFCLK